MSTPTTTIPNYIAGTFDIDPVHSDITFTVRHLGVSKVRGRFNDVSGQIVTGESIEDSKVSAKIDATTVDTKNDQRDEHVKGEDFLHVAEHTSLAFASKGVRVDGEDFLIDGDLTLRGVTKPVTLTAELGGFGDGMQEGSKVVGVSAKTEIKRSDFEVGVNIPTAVVSDKITIELDIEAVQQA